MSVKTLVRGKLWLVRTISDSFLLEKFSKDDYHVVRESDKRDFRAESKLDAKRWIQSRS